MELKVKKFSSTAILPTKAFDYEAGWDFYANEDITLLSYSGKIVDEIDFEFNDEFNDELYEIQEAVSKIKTGIGMEIPREYCLILKDRSSFAAKGVHILGGVIDSSYRGEIMVMMVNFGYDDVEIKQGQKFAQGLLQLVPIFSLREVEELTPSVRGVLGFGSTGQ